MSRQTTKPRRYGRQSKKGKSDRLFAELSPTLSRNATVADEGNGGSDVAVAKLTERVTEISLQDENCPSPPSPHQRRASPIKSPRLERRKKIAPAKKEPVQEPEAELVPEPGPELVPERGRAPAPKPKTAGPETPSRGAKPQQPNQPGSGHGLSVLTWSEVCPPGDKIVKIAEASYAEVYRVTNERGTSIIKAIRMESPIKAQTKTQEKSGLVDEEPHSESDLMGELKISEWLADIPGFVVYKERYVVQGRACRELLETHQTFHRKAKRQDPDRLQFYPSPSRYLDDTKFLVVELGDAGSALEDFELTSTDQLWDIFFHVAIALARAEVHIEFEHRDLHEGNLCIRQASEPVPPEDRASQSYFGHSGLEITILDYGLSRARGDLDTDESEPVAYDLERDLSIFKSEHAPQCRVYRQMRSFLLRGDRTCLPPKSHNKAYQEGIDGPLCWAIHEPYTNVLWLAYTYDYLVRHFQGPKKDLNAFKRATKDLWTHLDPDADDSVPGFASASDIVLFAVEAGWVDADQLAGGKPDVEKSILSALADNDVAEGSSLFSMDDSPLRRRAPRRRRP